MNPTRTSTTLVRVAVGAGRGFIVLALALGALLFTLSAPVAHAAPPEVTTPDNPVMIPYSQDTKEITLKWTLAALQLAATLTVTESGTPAPVLDQVVFSTPDTTKLTVTYGKTYTAQLKDAGSQQPIGAPLIITTARLDIKFDPGCLVQCITSADPMPPPYGVHGGWAQFRHQDQCAGDHHTRGQQNEAERQRQVERPRCCGGLQRDDSADPGLEAAAARPGLKHDLLLRRARP